MRFVQDQWHPNLIKEKQLSNYGNTITMMSHLDRRDEVRKSVPEVGVMPEDVAWKERGDGGATCSRIEDQN